MGTLASRELLRQHGLRAKKSLGQHFLTDGEVVAKTLDAAQLGAQDIVVEVGPGLGALTEALAARALRVIAVELDTNLVALLRERLSRLPNVTIVHANVLDLDPGQLVSEHGRGEAGEAFRAVGYKVVANLPYYVAAPVLRHFLEAEQRPDTMVVMVQKEVGETMAARPGKMGLLSLAVQVYGKPSIVGNVPACSFHPPPKVDSVIVAIDVYREPLAADPVRFFRIARAGFSAPRKQLHNSLSQGLGLPVPEVKGALERVAIDGRRRPGTLTLEEWDALCRVFP